MTIDVRDTIRGHRHEAFYTRMGLDDRAYRLIQSGGELGLATFQKTLKGPAFRGRSPANNEQHVSILFGLLPERDRLAGFKIMVKTAFQDDAIVRPLGLAVWKSRSDYCKIVSYGLQRLGGEEERKEAFLTLLGAPVFERCFQNTVDADDEYLLYDSSGFSLMGDLCRYEEFKSLPGLMLCSPLYPRLQKWAQLNLLSLYVRTNPEAGDIVLSDQSVIRVVAPSVYAVPERDLPYYTALAIKVSPTPAAAFGFAAGVQTRERPLPSWSYPISDHVAGVFSDHRDDVQWRLRVAPRLVESFRDMAATYPGLAASLQEPIALMNGQVLHRADVLKVV